MSAMQGIIRGKTVELDRDPGLAEGQVVEVVLRTVPPPGDRSAGTAVRRTAGALAGRWTDDDDRILAALEREREDDPRPEPGS